MISDTREEKWQTCFNISLRWIRACCCFCSSSFFSLQKAARCTRTILSNSRLFRSISMACIIRLLLICSSLSFWRILWASSFFKASSFSFRLHSRSTSSWIRAALISSICACKFIVTIWLQLKKIIIIYLLIECLYNLFFNINKLWYNKYVLKINIFRNKNRDSL